MKTSEIRYELLNMAEEDYHIFSSKLIPNINNIIGVRIPELQKFAKTLAKDEPYIYLETSGELYFEEFMLKGLIIANLKTDLSLVLEQVKAFVPKINNWSVCDSFCTHLKITNQHKSEIWQFLQQYRNSASAYELRFLIVMILCYYIEEEYLFDIFQVFNETQHEDYYVKMAVAWAVSVCMVKFPYETFEYFENHALDEFTYRKALQKSLESTRIPEENKDKIRILRKQL